MSDRRRIPHMLAMLDLTGLRYPGVPPVLILVAGRCAFRHEVPTYPLPGLISPGFEAAGVFSPEGGDTSM